MSKSNVSSRPTNSSKRGKALKLLAAIFIGVPVIGIFCFFMYRYVEQQRDLRELSEAGGKLQVVYDKLLATSGDSVSNSSGISKVCAASYNGFVRTGVTCSISAVIDLKKSVAVDTADGYISEYATASGLTSIEPVVQGGLDASLQISYSSSTRCRISYGQRNGDAVWIYSLSCSMETDDFLPGYEIMK